MIMAVYNTILIGLQDSKTITASLNTDDYIQIALVVIIFLAMIYAMFIKDLIKKDTVGKQDSKRQEGQQNIMQQDAEMAEPQIHDNSMQQSNEHNNEVDNNTMENQLPMTRDLFIQFLKEMGCNYTFDDEHEARIIFPYQGQSFFADTSNDCAYVHIWYTFWRHVELYDVEAVSALRKAINNANITTMVTSCYTIDEAGKNMYAHSKIVIPLVEGIPNRNQYIAAAFDDFFAARHMVDAEMAKSRNE